MEILTYASSGFSGELVAVEVDIRRGIPTLEIVGLPDSAVREAKDRVRVAIRQSGFDFPMDRILVNLSPAAIKKVGASYDLPIALGIILSSGQINPSVGFKKILCSGELMLNGTLRAVGGVLSAASLASESGVTHLLVPSDNLNEALIIKGVSAAGINNLKDIQKIMSGNCWHSNDGGELSYEIQTAGQSSDSYDISNIKGQPLLKRAMEIAAAGRHHMLFFGPPGSGKTMAARTFKGLLPDMGIEKSIEVTRIWSQAGKLGAKGSLIIRPPFREPHHTSSAEGLIGGGNGDLPGEVSMAHQGVLFLDEAAEFQPRVLQTLREPLESAKVEMARSGKRWWYPADFQLIMSVNPCPCGNLGKEDGSCVCSVPEISRYWRRLGGALLDRIDIRIPVSPVEPDTLFFEESENSEILRGRVLKAAAVQRERFKNELWNYNARIPPGAVNSYVKPDPEAIKYFSRVIRTLGLSSRAAHSILKVSRTIADLGGREKVGADDILEAVQHRRFGERDLYWLKL